MEKDAIMDKLRELAKGRVAIDPALLNENMNVSSDLGLTSLTVTDLLLEVEEQFKFEFNENDLVTIKTIGDLVEIIRKTPA